MRGAPADVLRRLRALVVKEGLQILRDPSSMLIAFVLPLLLLFIFGYGVSLDTRGLHIGLVMEDYSAEVADLAAAFGGSPYFELSPSRDRRQFERALLAGEVDGIVVVPEDFSAQLAEGGEAPLQVITDGSDPNTASFVANYVRGAFRRWLEGRALEEGAMAGPPVAAVPRFWFNSELDSHHFLVPGSVAIVMTLIGTLLTALVVAREWERGTMEALMATPIGIVELLLGKLLPYYLLGMGSMLLSVALAVVLFGVPFRGSVAALSLTTTAFLAAALSLGLLISTLARNQFVASQVALLSAFLPAFVLSGFIFEIASMPAPIQWITYALPARYFVASLQTLFLAGDIWSVLGPNLLAMALIATLLAAVTARRTVKRLD